MGEFLGHAKARTAPTAVHAMGDPLDQALTVTRQNPVAADEHELLPRGTIEISEPRELLAQRSSSIAWEPDGAVAAETLSEPKHAFGYGFMPPTAVETKPIEIRDDRVVWGGGLAHHFGHFLTESVTRLWPLVPASQLDGLPIVFGVASKSPFASEWLDGFGADTVDLPAKGVVKFTRMIVPESAWRFGAWIAPEVRDIHLHARAGMRIPSAPRRDVLWLSRSCLARGRAALDESLLEWILADHITPVHLEMMTLAEQIGLLENCRAVTGVMGSAFHALLMTVNTPDCLHLCPAFVRSPYIAQHRLLDGNVTFAEALRSEARVPRLRARNRELALQRKQRRVLYFPAGHRLMIPDALAALASTLLPQLREDPRIATFTNPKQRGFMHLCEIDAAVLDVLRDPLSAPARRRLASMFNERSLQRCAEEQLEIVTDLQPVDR